MDLSMDMAATGGWNDEEIIIDDDVNAADANLENQGANSVKDDSQSKYGTELEFFDNLAKDSSLSVGSASREEQNQFNPSPDKSQGYDAVGSLFSFLTSNVRAVAESATAKQMVENVQSVPNISAGATYLRQATSTLIGGQPVDAKQIDGRPSGASSNSLASPEPFTDLDYPPEWQVSDMDKQVMEHLVRENRELKQALSRQKKQQASQNEASQLQATSDEKDEIIRKMQAEINLLKESQNFEKSDVLDPKDEFEEIKNLYSMHRVDFEQEDIVKLYSSSYFSRDKLQLNQLKMKLFQSLAERAIRSQEILLKSTARKGKRGGAKPSEAQVYMENKQLVQQNTGLKGTVEQLTKSLHIAEEKSQAKSKKIQQLVQSLKGVQEQVGTLRNEQMMLRTFQQDLSHTLQSSYLFSPLIEQVKKHAASFDSELQTCRKAVYEKNNKINEQFMRQKEMSEEFEEQIKKTKVDLQKENEEQLQSIVMAKNKEIGRLFTENKEVNERAQGLEATMQEQTEQMDLVTEENQALKKQIQEQLMQGIGKIDQEAKMASLKKANEDLLMQIDQLNQHNEDAQEQLMNKDADIMQLQSDIEQRNKEFQQIEEEIDHYQIELDEKRDEIDCLKQQNEKLRELGAQAPLAKAEPVVVQQPADQTEYKKQYEDLKVEFDQLKALYEVARLGVPTQVTVPVQESKAPTNELEPNALKSFPDIPMLNLGNKGSAAAGVKNVLEKNEPIAKEPEIVNAWDDEIDLDEELLGLDNIDGSAATIGQGLISNPDDKIINNKEEASSPTLQLPQVVKQSSSENRISRQSSSQKSAFGEDDDPDFKHMRTALNTDHLTMIMKQIDAPQGESQQVEQYFKKLKRDKRKEAKKIQMELDMFLFDQNAEEVGSPVPAEGNIKQRYSKTMVEDKTSISNIKAKAYPAIEISNEKNNEVDEFLLYQENNEIPQVKFIDEHELPGNGPESIKPTKGSRDPRRQPSFSMPTSPQGTSNAAPVDIQHDDDDVRLITIDSGRKSMQIQGKETQSEDEMVHKMSKSDQYDSILLEPPSRLDKAECSTSQNGPSNPSAVKSHEKKLHLEKLMSEKLEEVPTPQQLQKTKTMKEGQYQDDEGYLKIQNDMDNDFSSSRFPDSVKNPNIQQESNFNFQQDQLLEGLASNDDSILHQNSGGDEELQKMIDANDPNGKQRTTSHQASNSLHQRHAEIINETDIQFDRLNSAEKPQISNSPLNQSPTNEQHQQKPNFKAINVGPVPNASIPSLKSKMVTGKRQPFTPDSKSRPFTAQIGEVTLNTAVLGNQKQPNEGPEQILSDLDEDIMPDETSPQKLGQASPASKGIDSSGPVQPDIEVIVEADECEEDLDDDQSKQHNDPRISMPSSQKSKKSSMTGKTLLPLPLLSQGAGMEPIQHASDSGPFAPAPEIISSQANSTEQARQSQVSCSPRISQKTRSLPKKLDLEIDIEEAENGERIEFKRQVEAVQAQVEDHMPANHASHKDGKQKLPVDKSAEQHQKNSKADEEEEETDNYSQNYRVTPSDDAPISRIEMIDHEYQNIIQYSEVISKDTSGISKQKSNNDPEGKIIEQRIIPVEKLISYQMDTTSQFQDPQDDQLNQIQTDITRKEKEEKAQNYAASRQPITAREQIMNPLNKVSGPGIRTASGNYNSNVHINQTISSLQSINSDDKNDIRPRKSKGGMLTSHGHSQSQQIKMPENKNASDIQFLNVNKSPIHSKREDFGKKAANNNQIIEGFGHDEGGKNVNINYGIFSESLEEVDDQYKESEFYSPLKQSKNDMTSMTSSVANSTFGASPSRLQQTMNKLIQMKILEEANQQRAANGQELQEGIFSEMEAESQLSSMVGLSPKAFDPSKKGTMPVVKFPALPKLNLEQAKLLEQEQNRENSDSVHPLFSATETPSAAAADNSNTPVFKKQMSSNMTSPDHMTHGDQSMTALMKSVTTEMQKNQEVVNKIDQVQKQMREQRESLLKEDNNVQDEKEDIQEIEDARNGEGKDGIEQEAKQGETDGAEGLEEEGEEKVAEQEEKQIEEANEKEKENVKEIKEADQEIKEDDLSLDLADLEDLENDTFAELTNQNKKESSDAHVTPEKQVTDLVEALANSADKPKPEAAISILDFLSEEVSPQKKAADILIPGPPTSNTAQTSVLDDLGILGNPTGGQAKAKVEPPTLDELGIMGQTSSQNEKVEKTVTNTGWDDEDLIGDDLMNDMNLDADLDV